MSVRWSRIHVSLGLTPRELTYKDVCDAVAQQVREDEDLDFKQALPPRNDQRKVREFAKDVAAMANTRGGLIVFGVSEVDERASQVCGVPNSEAERQRLSNVAASHIHPMVSGLRIFALDGEVDGPAFLVVSVPQSPDAPHLIGNDDHIGIPFRDGSNTRWMRERDLERAYSDRFARRASIAEALQDQRDDVLVQLDEYQGCWFVAASRPVMPTSTIGREPNQEDVQRVLEKALTLADVYMSSDRKSKASILGELTQEGILNPRIGLRRWIARTNPFASPDEPSKWVHVELHNDGSASFAASLEEWTVRTGRTETIRLDASLIESAIVDAVALAAVQARHFGGDTKIIIEIDLQRLHDDSKAMVLVDTRERNTMLRHGDVVRGSREVRKFKPAFVSVGATESEEILLAAARRLAEDVLNQFGVGASSITA